jgi:hypothetical protein
LGRDVNAAADRHLGVGEIDRRRPVEIVQGHLDIA